MLKIEVVKFEAQDVITSSVAAPTEAPTEPPKCACDGICNYAIISNRHYLTEKIPGPQCSGLEGTGEHTCGNGR